MAKQVTLANLTQYDGLIKNYVNTADAKAYKSAKFDEATRILSLYKAETTDGVADFTVEIPETDVSGLLEKLSGGVENNIVMVGADGAVKDSGVAVGDIATKAEVEAVSDLVGVIPDGYDATTIAEYAKELADNVAANGYDDTELTGKVDANTEDIAELGTNKADKATTVAGYGITDAYTKTEVDTAITTAVANAEHLKRSIVATLPDVADADTHTIYMVEITDGSGNQKYEEFMLINGAFEKIGDSAVDLTDYATDTEVTTAKTEAVDEAKAYADSLSVNYDAANSASSAQTNAQNYADGLNAAMDARVTQLETDMPSIEAITEEEINNLFA